MRRQVLVAFTVFLVQFAINLAPTAGQTGECQIWTQHRSAPTLAVNHRMAYDSLRQVTVLFSSTDASDGFWEWNGDDWSFRYKSGLGPLSVQSMTFDDAHGVMILIDNLGVTWVWDGAQWNPHAVDSPAPHSNTRIICDEGRAETLLFSGLDGSAWTWDGLTWKPKVDNERSLRHPAAFELAYDSKRGVVVRYDGGAFQQQATSEWDGKSWSLTSETGPAARSGFRMVYDSARRVTLLFGGEGCEKSSYCDDLWAWNGTHWTQIADSGPSARINPSFAYDEAREAVVLFGGITRPPSFTYVKDTWEWNGKSWDLLHEGGPPRLDSGVGMAFDAARHETIMIGGRSHNYWFDELSYTWGWDGQQWTKRFVGGPAPVSGHALAGGTTGNGVVLFGGWGESEPLGATWIWDGSNWTMFSDNGPSPRAEHSMVLDNKRGVVVLFGGMSINQTLVGDTWEWDGKQWAVRTSKGPEPRFDHAMSMDTRRGVVVLFGGTQYEPFRYFGDTWEWNGKEWSFRSDGGPPPRSGHSMVFDERIGATVLFGGDNSDMGGRFHDTWVWDGMNWSLRTQGGPNVLPGKGMSFDSDRGVTVMYGKSGISNATWELDLYRVTDADLDGVGDECDACPNTTGHYADDTGCAPADSDLDGDVDLFDFAGFQRCYSFYDNSNLTPECARYDMTRDGTINGDDFADSLNLFTGPEADE